ncbi:MAG TPA: aminopeptidase P family N-terminal domain-containing protein, partial [Thermomicrobiaceae bacterium]|nr:aminopeptidase P family N-terminal domain-containing protein [Thermomicrobiaceae bacterium]
MDDTRDATARRIERAQQLMESSGIDLLVIGPSSDFRYFTGHAPHLSERLTALLVPRTGQGTVVV